jgi:hypothetical protein
MAAAFTFDEYKLIEISYKPYIDNKYQNEAERAEVPETQQSNISVTSNIAIGQPEDNKYRMELIISITGAVHANIILYGFFTGMNFYESKERELQELTPIGEMLEETNSAE